MSAPTAGWDFRGFTEDFKLFGDFLLAYAAIAEKYCTPTGECTNYDAAAQEVSVMLRRWSDEELLQMHAFTRDFCRSGAPQIMVMTMCELAERQERKRENP